MAIEVKSSHITRAHFEELKKASNLTVLEGVSFRAFRIAVLALSIFVGGVLGAVIGSGVPFIGTAGGAAIGGAFAFAIAFEILDRYHAYLKDRALERYLAAQEVKAE